MDAELLPIRRRRVPQMTENPQSSGANRPPEKPKKVRGIVYLNASRCKGCGFCIAFCPQHVLEFSADFNAQGYHPPRLNDPDGCTGCDLCGLYCPDFAIHGVMLKYAPKPAEKPTSEAREVRP
jgi:2-oxoglutarate ferredoxin oxidoreductase subunit delta